jgi:crossover junction endodeoxyribonuclease RusA
MIECRFTVPGAAAPQGSKRAIKLRGSGRVVLVESSAKVKPYRAVVALAAREAWNRPPTGKAVYVRVAFTFARPKSHHTGKGAIRSGAPDFPGKPDIDKLCRAVLDALTGVVYGDDAQVVRLEATKDYGDTPGTAIEIREMSL